MVTTLKKMSGGNNRYVLPEFARFFQQVFNFCYSLFWGCLFSNFFSNNPFWMAFRDLFRNDTFRACLLCQVKLKNYPQGFENQLLNKRILYLDIANVHRRRRYMPKFVNFQWNQYLSLVKTQFENTWENRQKLFKKNCR